MLLPKLAVLSLGNNNISRGDISIKAKPNSLLLVIKEFLLKLARLLLADKGVFTG